ncbi:UNKNOWN [Stylonychia lemnae]|uniref:Uncharacterized protein n=1 Tax=Stylonychia lemnae TaxID=5949 RepID=A0A078A1Y0_STYLE|nr:UNKNOWN [Stylonychia lemnae]|eukprot:CDW76246.1 UNKNOWN [Stylonychia lemnae]
MIGSSELLNIASLISFSTNSVEDRLLNIENKFYLPATDNADTDTFAVTISSTNATVNEIITKVGDFNYGSIEKIHSNPNRIFMPLIKYDDVGIYQVEIITLVSSKMVDQMDMANIIGRMEGFMKANGQMIIWKGQDCINGVKVIITMDNGRMIRDKEQEYSITRMEISKLASGRIIHSMEY